MEKSNTKITLVGIEGIVAGKQFKVEKQITNIGRAVENEIILEDMDVSRKHAQIKQIGDIVTIIDLNSTNGVFINRMRIKEATICDSDLIKVGNCVFKIELLRELKPAEEEATKFAYIKPIEIIEDIAKEIAPGEIKEVLSTIDKKEWQKESITKAYKNLFMLYQISKTVGKSSSINELLELVMDIVLELLPAGRGYLMLVDEKNNELELKVERYKNIERKFSISRSVVDKVKKEKVSVVATDATLDPRFIDSRSIIREMIRSILCVSICTQEKTFGVIYLDNRTQPGIFSEDNIDLLSAIANQVAIAIENIKLVNRIKEEEKIKYNLERYLPPHLVNRISEKKKSITLGGMQQKVTVLFTDIRNFTKLAESLPADIVVQILNKHFTTLTEIIFKHNGVLDKFIGDGLIAIFGTPFPTGKDAEEAVTCALELQKAVKESNPIIVNNHRINIEIGIGINTGFAIVGNIGSDKRMEYTVIGDVVNTAARIVTEAKAGEILINQPTYNEVKDIVVVELLGEIKVKGKLELLKLYKI